MSDMDFYNIKVVLPSKDKEKCADYLCDKIKETIGNEKACIVIYETDEGACASPSGSVVDLLTCLTLGSINIIDAIHERTHIPKQILLGGLITALKRCEL